MKNYFSCSFSLGSWTMADKVLQKKMTQAFVSSEVFKWEKGEKIFSKNYKFS